MHPAGVPPQAYAGGYAPYTGNWGSSGTGQPPFQAYIGDPTHGAGVAPVPQDGTRRREADHLTVPSIPQVTGVTVWKRQVGEAVAAASANPDPPSVYRWLGEAETRLNNPDHTLGYATMLPKFSTLDAKLLKALGDKIAASNM